MKAYVGLDVHSKKIFYAAMDQEGELLARGAVETGREGLEQMRRKLRLRPGTEVGLESGTQAFLVACWLCELGLEPRVINAREVRDKARRKNQKSDTRDAYDICDGLRRGIYQSSVYVPGPQVQRLRQILSRRRHFVKVSTMQINAAKFLLRSQGISHAGELGTDRAWQKLLGIAQAAPVAEHLRLHAEQWRLARQHIRRLEQQLQEALMPFEQQMKLLLTTPGVGLVTAATFIATVGDPSRFADAGKLASYVGLVPSSYDSGERVRHGHITRAGSAPLRAVLCEAAHHAGRIEHPLHPYWCRIMARSGYRRAVTAVAHRLARILYRIWLKQEAFTVKKLNVELKPGLKLKPVMYQLKRAG